MRPWRRVRKGISNLDPGDRWQLFLMLGRVATGLLVLVLVVIGTTDENGGWWAVFAVAAIGVFAVWWMVRRMI